MRLVRYQAARRTGVGAVRPDGSVVTTPWPDFGALFAEPDPLRAVQALDLSRQEPVAVHASSPRPLNGLRSLAPAAITPITRPRRAPGVWWWPSRHFDPVTIAVRDRATLDAWDEYLTSQGIIHSEVITAIQAWLIVVPDPDGHRLRLYTLETHGPELAPDEDNPWVRST
jgi:hypothetical protein